MEADCQTFLARVEWVPSPMTLSKHPESLSELWDEIERRMGVCPSFFRLASPAPDLARGLFGIARFAYLDSPIPAILKESLFVYLSRFCRARYCVGRHAAFLLGRGRVAGDPECPPLSPETVLSLLREPVPGPEERDEYRKRLGEVTGPVPGWTELATGLAREFRVACAAVMVDPGTSGPWLHELHRLLGPQNYAHLVLFLSFVRMAHFWAEVHPELRFDPDVEQLLLEQPSLAGPILDCGGDAERFALGARLHAELDELRRPVGREITRELRFSAIAESLRRSEQRLRLAQQAAHIGAFEWNMQTGVNTWTPELEAIHGLRPGEFARSQSAWEDLVHPEDRAAAQHSVVMALESGSPTATEWRILWPDGTMRWIAGRYQVLKDERGNPLCLTGINMDITAQKQAEEMARELQRMTERRRAEEQFHALLESAPDAMVVVDSTGRIVIVNSRTEKIFGYPRDELLGFPVEILLPEGIRIAHEKHRNRYLEDPHSRPMGAGLDLLGRRRDGEEFPVEICLSPIRTPEGLLISSAIRDITERRQAEETRAKLAAILEGVQDALIAMDLGGTITIWNRGADRLFGHSAEEIVGRTVDLLIPPELREREAAILMKLSRGERIEAYETVRCRKDGTRCDVSLTISPIRDSRGKVIGASKFVRDITERKRSEQLLLSSLREKETLLREIHHRVKNNLTVISSLFYLGSVDAPDARTVDLLQEAQDRVRSMALVHETLYQSKNLAEVDFAEYIRSLLGYLDSTYQASSRSLSLTTDLEAMSMDVDRAIPCGLILNELVTNCLKHAFPEGRSGTISISLKSIEPDRCLLVVADDGAGLPPGFDEGAGRSLGLRLMRSLTGQVEGCFEFRRTEPGTEARLTFRITNPRSEVFA